MVCCLSGLGVKFSLISSFDFYGGGKGGRGKRGKVFFCSIYWVNDFVSGFFISFICWGVGFLLFFNVCFDLKDWGCPSSFLISVYHGRNRLDFCCFTANLTEVSLVSSDCRV